MLPVRFLRCEQNLLGWLLSSKKSEHTPIKTPFPVLKLEPGI